MAGTLPISVAERRLTVTRWDLLAVLLVLGVLVFLAEASRDLLEPLTELQMTPISLDPAQPAGIRRAHDAAHAGGDGAVAASSPSPTPPGPPRAGAPSCSWCRCSTSCSRCRSSASSRSPWSSSCRWRPGRVLGAEFAAIFAIFTSQAWNMAFSFYQSLRTVPTELVEAARMFRLSRLDALLAPRRAVRHAGADLEHDDVDVGRLVLRRRLRGDQRRRYHRHPAGHRLLHRAGHRAARPRRHLLGDRHHAGGHPDLRPAAVPAAGRLGRPLPFRTGAGRDRRRAPGC